MWLKAFNYYVVGKGVTRTEQKVALLLHCAGMEVQDIFNTLDEFKKAVCKLNTYFEPKKNIPYERHLFPSMKQGEDTVDQYVSKLKIQGQIVSLELTWMNRSEIK